MKPPSYILYPITPSVYGGGCPTDTFERQLKKGATSFDTMPNRWPPYKYCYTDHS